MPFSNQCDHIYVILWLFLLVSTTQLGRTCCSTSRSRPVAASSCSSLWFFKYIHALLQGYKFMLNVCAFFVFQVIARLLAFMLFTLFWGPGNFYPLMIFTGIHMIVAAGLHIVFSEDIAYLRRGRYLKFAHNVTMNSFASIYFHNYLRKFEYKCPLKLNHQKTHPTAVRIKATFSF